MHKSVKNISGRRFGKWTVGEYIGGGNWRCVCDCGFTKDVNGQSLRNGRSRSCGCGHIYLKPPPPPNILKKCSNVGNDGCWEWIGRRSRRGYGQFDYNYRPRSASRYSYIQNVGPIPEGMHVLHTCDNPACCRPNHLFVGTNLDNVADKVAKGRQAKGQKVRKNHDHLHGEGVSSSKLTDEIIRAVIRRVRSGETQTSVAVDMGLSQGKISEIFSRKIWAHVIGEEVSITPLKAPKTKKVF